MQSSTTSLTTGYGRGQEVFVNLGDLCRLTRAVFDSDGDCVATVESWTKGRVVLRMPTSEGTCVWESADSADDHPANKWRGMQMAFKAYKRSGPDGRAYTVTARLYFDVVRLFNPGTGKLMNPVALTPVEVTWQRPVTWDALNAAILRVREIRRRELAAAGRAWSIA